MNVIELSFVVIAIALALAFGILGNRHFGIFGMIVGAILGMAVLPFTLWVFFKFFGKRR